MSWILIFVTYLLIYLLMYLLGWGSGDAVDQTQDFALARQALTLLSYLSLLTAFSLKGFENRFQDLGWGGVSMLVYRQVYFQMTQRHALWFFKCIEVQMDIRLKQIHDSVFSVGCYKIHTKNNLHFTVTSCSCHNFLPSIYIFIQPFSRIKHIKKKITLKISKEHLEKSLLYWAMYWCFTKNKVKYLTCFMFTWPFLF